jgi:hypothetical protein
VEPPQSWYILLLHLGSEDWGREQGELLDVGTFSATSCCFNTIQVTSLSHQSPV